MSKISIEVTGVTYWKARELAELLKKLEGVESTSVPWKTRDRAHDPDRLGLIILASTEAHKILVGLSLFIAAEYASGGIKEMGKEHYLELKKRMLRKLGEWRRQDQMSSGSASFSSSMMNRSSSLRIKTKPSLNPKETWMIYTASTARCITHPQPPKQQPTPP